MTPTDERQDQPDPETEFSIMYSQLRLLVSRQGDHGVALSRIETRLNGLQGLLTSLYRKLNQEAAAIATPEEGC